MGVRTGSEADQRPKPHTSILVVIESSAGPAEGVCVPAENTLAGRRSVDDLSGEPMPRGCRSMCRSCAGLRFQLTKRKTRVQHSEGRVGMHAMHNAETPVSTGIECSPYVEGP